MRVKRLDSITLSPAYYTKEGYLVDRPVVTTTGIFEYENADGTVRKELRLPEDVFDEKSLKSYKGKPIIITHDAGAIDKENVSGEQIGTIMSEGYRDGDSVRVEIIIHNTNALAESGLKALSLGYSLDTDETPGVYEGEPYDCIQKNIVINHLALVTTARAGKNARLNIDGTKNETLKGGKGMEDTKNGGLTPEELEAAIALFKAQQAATQATGSGADGEDPEMEQEKEVPDEKSPIDKVKENIKKRDSNEGNMAPEEVIAAQKADIEVLMAEIDKMKAEKDMNKDEENNVPEDEKEQEEVNEEKGVNMDSVDAMFRERLDISKMADRLNLDGVDSLSVKEAKKKIIKAVNPKMNLDGKSDAYIDAAYDLAKQKEADRKTTDDQRKRVAEEKVRKDSSIVPTSVDARKNMIKRMMNGGKA